MKKNSFTYYLEMIINKQLSKLPSGNDLTVNFIKTIIKAKLLSIKNNNEIEKFIKWFENEWKKRLGEKVYLDKVTNKEIDKWDNKWSFKINIPSSVDKEKSYYTWAKGLMDDELAKSPEQTPEWKTEVKPIQEADIKDAKKRHILLIGLIQAVLEIQKENLNLWIQLKDGDYNKYSGERATFKIKKFPE